MVCECLPPCRPSPWVGTDGSSASLPNVVLHSGSAPLWGVGRLAGRDLFSVCICNYLSSLPGLLLPLYYVNCTLKSITSYFCIVYHYLPYIPSACHSTYLVSNCSHFYIDLQEIYLWIFKQALGFTISVLFCLMHLFLKYFVL